MTDSSKGHLTAALTGAGPVHPCGRSSPHPRGRFAAAPYRLPVRAGSWVDGCGAGFRTTTKEETMKLFTSGRYAAVASTAALVVALGGTSYAAAQITGARHQGRHASARPISHGRARPTSSRSTTTPTPRSTARTKTVLSLNLRPGTYLLTGKVNLYVNAGGYGDLLADRSGRQDARLRRTATTRDRGGYGEVVNHRRASACEPDRDRPAELHRLERQRRRQEAGRPPRCVGHRPGRRERGRRCSPARCCRRR